MILAPRRLIGSPVDSKMAPSFTGPNLGQLVFWSGRSMSTTKIYNTGASTFTLQRDGTFGSAVTIGNGKFGLAIKMAANANDYISIGTSFLQPLTEQTLAMWICPAANNVALWGETNASNQITHGMSINASGFPEWSMNGGSGFVTLTGSIVCPLNVWSHVAFLLSTVNSRKEIYLNGVLIGSSSNTTHTASGQIAEIGSFPNSGTHGTNYSGMMDQICVWSRALEINEVQRFFNTPMLPLVHCKRRIVAPKINSVKSRGFGLVL